MSVSPSLSLYVLYVCVYIYIYAYILYIYVVIIDDVSPVKSFNINQSNDRYIDHKSQFDQFLPIQLTMAHHFVWVQRFRRHQSPRTLACFPWALTSWDQSACCNIQLFYVQIKHASVSIQLFWANTIFSCCRNHDFSALTRNLSCLEQRPFLSPKSSIQSFNSGFFPNKQTCSFLAGQYASAFVAKGLYYQYQILRKTQICCQFLSAYSSVPHLSQKIQVPKGVGFTCHNPTPFGRNPSRACRSCFSR